MRFIRRLSQIIKPHNNDNCSIKLVQYMKPKNNIIRSNVKWEIYFKSLPNSMKKQIIELKLDDNNINDFETKMALMYVHHSY